MGVAPTPWRVDRGSRHDYWTDSCSILDARGGVVCVLSRGYQSEVVPLDGDMENREGCPSWDNAELIVAAVNAHQQTTTQGKP